MEHHAKQTFSDFFSVSSAKINKEFEIQCRAACSDTCACYKCIMDGLESESGMQGKKAWVQDKDDKNSRFILYSESGLDKFEYAFKW